MDHRRRWRRNDGRWWRMDNRCYRRWRRMNNGGGGRTNGGGGVAWTTGGAGGMRVNDIGRGCGRNRRRQGRRIDARFRSQIHCWRWRGSGGLGSGFTIVLGVAAGGLAPGGGVTTTGAFPLRGVVGTPNEGVAMLGAAGSGFAPGAAVTVAGRFPTGVATGGAGQRSRRGRCNGRRLAQHWRWSRRLPFWRQGGGRDRQRLCAGESGGRGRWLSGGSGHSRRSRTR
jgi:hypothetical protein